MSNGVKAKNSENKFFTVEFFGVTLIITSFLLLVCLIFGGDVLFVIGKEVQSLLLGLFGYVSYPLLCVLIAVGFAMLFGKKIEKQNVKSKIIVTVAFLVLAVCLLTVLTSISKPVDLGEYLSHAMNSGKNGIQGVVAGGAVFSLIVYPFVSLITNVGAIILFAVIIIALAYFTYKKAKKSASNETTSTTTTEVKEYPGVINSETTTANNINAVNNAINNPYNQNNFNQQYAQNVGSVNNYGVNNPYNQPVYPQNNAFNPQPNVYPQNMYQQNGYNQNVYPQNNGFVNPYEGNRFNANNYQPTAEEVAKRNESMRILYGEPVKYYSQEYNNSFNEEKLRVVNNNNNGVEYEKTTTTVSNPIAEVNVNNESYDFEDNSFEEEVYEEFDDSVVDVDDVEENNVIEDTEKTNSFFNKIRNKNVEKVNEEVKLEVPEEKKVTVTKKFSPSVMPDLVQESADVVQPENKYLGNIIENMPKNYKYNPPPISLFKTIDNSQNNYENEIFKNDIKGRILTTLSTFGVDTTIANVFRGPAVTRFDIVVPPAMSMSRIVKLNDDLNLRIAAKSAIRMVAPVPNTSYIGVEVPNQKADSVCLKDIISSDGFINTPPFSLYFAFGKDIIGNPVSLNLADMPHVLISGTTGSGKSVCINSMILSLISKYGPDQLRFVIIDPKQVDFEPFRELPHMMFNTIIDNDLALCNSVLTWAVEEMERRYSELKVSKSKNIGDYNRRAVQNKERIMPRIVIIIDEFADLMMRDKKGIGEKICLIAQKSRAAGIHLVLAAQRPSADVVNGPIKANLPARLVFRASSHVDSTVSLGEPGAEKLLGKGDCLYKTGGMLNTERAMGAYVSDDELYDIVDYVAKNNVAYYDHNSWTKIRSRVEVETIEVEMPSNSGGSVSGGKASGGVDQVYVDAMRVGFDYDGISVSSLQRRLGLGYPRAAKVVDWLVDNGYISAESSHGKKAMLITREEYEEKFCGGASNNEEDSE